MAGETEVGITQEVRGDKKKGGRDRIHDKIAENNQHPWVLFLVDERIPAIEPICFVSPLSARLHARNTSLVNSITLESGAFVRVMEHINNTFNALLDEERINGV